MRQQLLLWFAAAAALVYVGFCIQSPIDRFDDLPQALRPFRPVFVSLLNHLMQGTKWPSLEAEDIMRDAVRKTGISDFQDDDTGTFLLGLNKLCESLRTEAKLNFVGRVLTRAQIDVVVENRLKVGKAAAAAAAQQSTVQRPVFVAGMPRSGTTFLHNLMSLDEENFRAPRLWEIVDPLPALHGVEGKQVERFVRKKMSAAGTALFRYLAPNFAAVHPVDSMNAEECMPILSLSMLSFNFYTMCNVPAYNDWLMQQDQTEALLWHKNFLQVSQTPGNNNTVAWLLKAPWHMNHLDVVLKVYPDARIIVPHRDPSGMLASLSSLHARLFGLTSDELDLHALGKYTQSVWELIIGRFMRARRDLLPENTIVDVYFENLKKDPIATVKKVYSQLGVTLSPQAEQRMLVWLANDVKLGKRGASGVHEYSPEWFGLKEEEISNLPNFQAYKQKYKL